MNTSPTETESQPAGIAVGCATVLGFTIGVPVLLAAGLVCGLCGFGFTKLTDTFAYAPYVGGAISGLLAAVAGVPVGGFFGGLWHARRPRPNTWREYVPQMDRVTRPLMPWVSMIIWFLSPETWLTVVLLTAAAGVGIFAVCSVNTASFVTAGLPLLSAGLAFAFILSFGD